MAKNTTKQKQDDIKLRRDIASFKASCAFIIFCLIMFLTVSNIENNAETYKFRNYLDNNIWLMAIPLGIFAVSAILRILAESKKIDEGYRYFSTYDFLGLASLFVAYSVIFAATTSIFMYNMVVVAFALGYYVKRFFGTDFYAVTLLNISVAFALWLMFGIKGWGSSLSSSAIRVLFIGCALIAILVVAFAIGKLAFKKNDKNILHKALCIFGVKSTDVSSKPCFIPVFVSLVLGAVLAVILKFAPTLMTLLVAEIIILIQYIALGVFYTVKLINE